MEDDQDAHLDNNNYSFMHKSDENYNQMQSSIDTTEIRESKELNYKS